MFIPIEKFYIKGLLADVDIDRKCFPYTQGPKIRISHPRNFNWNSELLLCDNDVLYEGFSIKIVR